jgi:Zn-dependent protease
MDFGFYNWMDKISRYSRFSRKEMLWLGISILVMTFIVGFNDGSASLDPAFFISNMLFSLIAVAIAVLVHEAAHKITAPNLGTKVEFKPFFYGLLGGLILSFMSYGKIIFLAYSSFQMSWLEKHRLGYFRHKTGYFDQGKIAVVGPLANLAVAMVFKSIGFLPESLVTKIVLVNALFAIYNMLPIPPLDGAHVMYATKTVYPFAAAAVIGAAALLLLPQANWWKAVLGAFVIGVAFTFVYFNIIEKKLFGEW